MFSWAFLPCLKIGLNLILWERLTRAKKKLKIYWSAETMKEIVSGFATNESNGKSLEIVKAKLAVTQ